MGTEQYKDITLARLASFSTETLLGKTGNLGSSSCGGNCTLVSSLL